MNLAKQILKSVEVAAYKAARDSGMEHREAKALSRLARAGFRDNAPLTHVLRSEREKGAFHVPS